MSKEESLIPSVRSFITPAMAIQVPLNIQSFWISAMKAYGEEVRRITIEEVVDRVRVCINGDDKGKSHCLPSNEYIQVNENELLNLKESDRLKIS